MGIRKRTTPRQLLALGPESRSVKQALSDLHGSAPFMYMVVTYRVRYQLNSIVYFGLKMLRTRLVRRIMVGLDLLIQFLRLIGSPEIEFKFPNQFHKFYFNTQICPIPLG